VPARDPKKAFQFTFQDLLFLKTAKGLLDSRVPSKRIIRMLSSLKRQLPDDQHLSGLKIYADGRRVIVWDGKARWQPDSGQFLFNFDARSVVEKIQLPRPAPKPVKDKLTAEHWFNLGVELEATSTKEAQRAYHMALALEPKMAAAHLNLGKLYHDAGELEKAEAHYRAAGASDPRTGAPLQPGCFTGRSQTAAGAVRAYCEAIKLDSIFADAHYNLALLFESMGKKAELLLISYGAENLSEQIGVRHVAEENEIDLGRQRGLQWLLDREASLFGPDGAAAVYRRLRGDFKRKQAEIDLRRDLERRVKEKTNQLRRRSKEEKLPRKHCAVRRKMLKKKCRIVKSLPH
jgi:tetratricopeptide (TPR) repeat protein